MNLLSSPLVPNADTMSLRSTLSNWFQKITVTKNITARNNDTLFSVLIVAL